MTTPILLSATCPGPDLTGKPRHRVTLNLSVGDARNLSYHLKDTYALNADRERAVRSTRDKLALQLSKILPVTRSN